MKTPQKYPEVKALLEALKAEKNAIQEKTIGLRGKRDRLLASIQPVLDEIRELEEEYIAIERPRLGELDNQISTLTRILGGRRMSEGPTTKPAGA
jgi:uncharacterized coiled-coil DUF342 family protein